MRSLDGAHRSEQHNDLQAGTQLRSWISIKVYVKKNICLEITIDVSKSDIHTVKYLIIELFLFLSRKHVVYVHLENKIYANREAIRGNEEMFLKLRYMCADFKWKTFTHLFSHLQSFPCWPYFHYQRPWIWGCKMRSCKETFCSTARDVINYLRLTIYKNLLNFFYCFLVY